MRVRFFNTYEPVNSFYRDLVPFLALKGIRIELLLSQAEYRSGRGSLEEAVRHPGVEVTRMPAGLRVANSRWAKLYVMGTYILGVIVSTLFGRGADLNIFLTQPPFFALWGYVLKRVRRQRYLCLIMDMYPDVAVQAGLINSDALATRSMQALGRFILRRADGVIVIGRCMADRVSAMNVPPDRIHVIPNWANENTLLNVSHHQNPLRKSLGLDGCFVVLYSGNMGVSHFFDDILAVAQRCLQFELLRFIFIGHGSRRGEIEQAIRINGLHNTMLLPFQDADRLSESLSLGDVHFVSLRSGFEGLVVPSKAYSVLAVGRPLIYQGNSESEIARMVIDETIGTVVPLKDPESLERAILNYYHNPELLADHGRRALELTQGAYGSEHGLNRYYALINSMQETSVQKSDETTREDVK